MLTDVKVYSSWRSAPTLPLDVFGSPETDLIQIRNIDGLDPVKATISMTPRGAVDGASFSGSSVQSRNIVLTIHPNPDWVIWTYEKLRRLVYSYFMPKRPTQLIFYSDDMDPVEISGIVESVNVNSFSKDLEILVSIICPDPYFSALTATVITGQTIRSGGAVSVVAYNGSIETGVKVKVSQVSGATPTNIRVEIGNSIVRYFTVTGIVDTTKYYELSSVPMQKFAHNVNIGTGVIDNLLSQEVDGSSWPILEPGNNNFSVITDQGNQDWELTFYEKFGGL